MIARLLIKPFGSMWSLKKLCLEAKNSIVKKILLSIYGLYQYENNSFIAYNSTFIDVPCFPHGTKGIFISRGAVIGSNCVIFQQVTIGSSGIPDSEGFGAPTVGNNCYIGAGAKIIGNVRIGDNVRVGANSVVYKDVPDNSVVVSGEQKTITKDSPLDNKFYALRDRWFYYEDSRWIPVVDESVLSKLNRKKCKC